jgi:putative ABC transport system substrate-binding protein
MGKTLRWSRRALLTLTLLAFVSALPSAAHAQQTGKIWHIGLFHVGLDHEPPSLPTLKEELTHLGYVEGKNLVFDWRNQESEETAQEVAREWVAKGYDLIVAFEDQCVRAAKKATSSIPIVFVHALDPIAAGYIRSLSRPGTNITGPVSNLTLIGKRLELLKRIDPQVSRVLVLTDHDDPFAHSQLELARTFAAPLGIELVERNTPTRAELERAFAELKPHEVDGVIVASNDVITNLSRPIVTLAERARLPLVAHRRGWVEMGALFSYAPDFAAAGPVAARYIDKILRGQKPADLPVEEISRIDLVINQKVAEKLGLTIPPDVLLLAEEIIE